MLPTGKLMKKRISVPITAKLNLDLVMAGLFAACLGFRLTESKTHECLGAALFAAFAAHTWMNRLWYANLFKGTYTLRRAVNTTINLALLGLMLLIVLSGMANSHHLLGFMELPGSMRYRVWHTSASYWSLVLAGVHLGLHRPLITGVIRRKTGDTLSRPGIVLALRLVGFCFLVLGVWASFDREMAPNCSWDTDSIIGIRNARPRCFT